MYRKRMYHVAVFFMCVILSSFVIISCHNSSNIETSVPETTETQEETTIEVIETEESTEVTETEQESKSVSIAVTQEEFDIFLEEFAGNYIEEDYQGLWTEYTKTINGYMTNEYYMVFKDGKIQKKNVSITKEEIEEAEKWVLVEYQYKIPEKNDFGVYKDSYEAIEYHKVNGKIIPVKAIFATYVNSKGHTNVDTIVINLLDGTLMEYDDLMWWE